MPTPYPFVDSLRSLRLNNLFAPQLQQPDNTPQPVPQDDPNYVNTRMQQLYSPQTAAMNQYMTSTANPPVDQRPSMLSRIAAMIAGMGTGGPVGVAGGQPIGFKADPAAAFNVSHGILDAPNAQADAKFKGNADIMYKRAQLEDTMNKMNQSNAVNIIGKELADRKERDTTSYYQGRLGVEQDNNIIKKATLALQTWKAQHPNYTIKETKGGNFIGVNPQDPNDIIDTGVKSGTLSDAAKLQLGLQDKINFFNKTQPIIQQDRMDLQNNGANRVDARVSAPTTTTSTVTDAKGKPAGKKVTSTQKEIPKINPMASHSDAAPSGKIRVKRKSDNQTGTIDAKDFDPNKYEKIQ
jgi:hypothetical protein